METTLLNNHITVSVLKQHTVRKKTSQDLQQNSPQTGHINNGWIPKDLRKYVLPSLLERSMLNSTSLEFKFYFQQRNYVNSFNWNIIEIR